MAGSLAYIQVHTTVGCIYMYLDRVCSMCPCGDENGFVFKGWDMGTYPGRYGIWIELSGVWKQKGIAVINNGDRGYAISNYMGSSATRQILARSTIKHEGRNWFIA